jgi:hypothetical protein
VAEGDWNNPAAIAGHPLLLDLSKISDMSDPHWIPPRDHPKFADIGPDERWLYPFWWFPCQHVERTFDEACLFASHCEICEWAFTEFHLPCPPELVPKLPQDAPRFRL